ncbi:DUF4169 family protein [Sphingomonas desiccabilis]|uniref:DUF4169 family protein n=1 Tax=Sphingomonas desiccabilis TaxID=429134 RepID=A0A4Q2IQ36_9SPHN|nr:DUF4169 family protein [Sphingomonas desiccabilis]MBB3912117.1 hypothetical protein [Sphingomonas desiccabilis]RXZ30282.1 DUF4169 family protein [Sphingomonas desiccabilis]
MAEIINLNRARKARARAEKATEADANRHRFGRTKAQKAAEAQDRDRAERTLDGAQREDKPD